MLRNNSVHLVMSPEFWEELMNSKWFTFGILLGATIPIKLSLSEMITGGLDAIASAGYKLIISPIYDKPMKFSLYIL